MRLRTHFPPLCMWCCLSKKFAATPLLPAKIATVTQVPIKYLATPAILAMLAYAAVLIPETTAPCHTAFPQGTSPLPFPFSTGCQQVPDDPSYPCHGCVRSCVFS